MFVPLEVCSTPHFLRGFTGVCALKNTSHFHWILSFFPIVGTIDVGKTRLMFWDLGGQEELQSLWDKVGDAFVFLLEMFLSLLEAL